MIQATASASVANVWCSGSPYGEPRNRVALTSPSCTGNQYQTSEMVSGELSFSSRMFTYEVGQRKVKDGDGRAHTVYALARVYEDGKREVVLEGLLASDLRSIAAEFIEATAWDQG